MQLNPSSKSLDSFFSSDDQVMAIRGPWGVGKTYLWDTYIQNRISLDRSASDLTESRKSVRKPVAVESRGGTSIVFEKLNSTSSYILFLLLFSSSINNNT
jgi:hypothetical protein